MKAFLPGEKKAPNTVSFEVNTDMMEAAWTHKKRNFETGIYASHDWDSQENRVGWRTTWRF